MVLGTAGTTPVVVAQITNPTAIAVKDRVQSVKLANFDHRGERNRFSAAVNERTAQPGVNRMVTTTVHQFGRNNG